MKGPQLCHDVVGNAPRSLPPRAFGSFQLSVGWCDKLLLFAAEPQACCSPSLYCVPFHLTLQGLGLCSEEEDDDACSNGTIGSPKRLGSPRSKKRTSTESWAAKKSLRLQPDFFNKQVFADDSYAIGA